MTQPTPPPVIVQVPGEWAWEVTCSKCGQVATLYQGTKRQACVGYITLYPAGKIDLRRNTAHCGCK